MIDVAYIALGSNVGDRLAYLSRARAALGSLPDSHIVAQSAIEETAPLGGMVQGAYLNQMVALETALPPDELLAQLHRIEQREGRTREVRWGPRTIDLDIVCFDEQTVNEPNLLVPHPELPNRDFWQRELAELRGGRGA
jgi:2-amino-4-hydroxy-6-hydroxymethyldihydropteridine diphosphokinase